jgi:hypothetical protein
MEGRNNQPHYQPSKGIKACLFDGEGMHKLGALRTPIYLHSIYPPCVSVQCLTFICHLI